MISIKKTYICYILFIIAGAIFIPRAETNQGSKRVYQVEVRLSIGSTSRNVKIIVEANNSFEAERAGKRIALYGVKADAVNCREIKK